MYDQTLLGVMSRAVPAMAASDPGGASGVRQLKLDGGRRPFCRPVKPQQCYTGHMKVEEIAEAVAKLPSDELARFRRWFTAFEAGRTNHAEELNSAATKLGRLAGRAFAELKKRAKEP